MGKEKELGEQPREESKQYPLRKVIKTATDENIEIIIFPRSFFDYINFMRDLQFGKDRDQPYREVPEEEARKKWPAYYEAKRRERGEIK